MAKKSVTLPRGILVWPKLNAVDDKFGKRQYKTRIEFADEDHRKVDAWLKKFAKDAGKADAKLGWKKDKQTGKLGLEAKSGEKYPPQLLDAKGKEIPRSKVQIGGGTVAKVNVTPNVYDGFGGGINLYLNYVQIIELKKNERFEGEAEEGFSYEGDEDEALLAPNAGEEEDEDLPF